MANDLTKNVGVVFTMNNDKFNSNLKNTNAQIQLTAKQLKTAEQNVKTYGDNLVNLGSKQQRLNEQETNYKDKLKLLNEAFKSNTEKLKENKTTLESLSNKKKELKEQIQAAEKEYGKESQEVQSLKEKLAGINTEYTETNNRIKTNVSALNSEQKQIEDTKAKMSSLQGEINKTNKAIAQNSNSFLNASKSLEASSKKMNAFGTGMSTVGGDLMKLSAPMVAVSAAAIKVGVDFEASMSQVRATCSPTEEEFEKLRTKSIELGRDIKGASSKEVADSFNTLAMAGYKTGQMLDSIEPSVKSSIAFNADMATVTSLCADDLKGLGLSADDTSRFLDIVAQASRNADTSGQQLLEAYSPCSGMFRELKTPLQESSTLLSILANNNKKGAEAGNSMNAVLINLMGNSGQAKKGMKALGLSAYDAKGHFKGVTNVLKEMKSKMGSWTDQQKQMVESMVGGKTQFDTLSALLNGVGSDYDDLSGKISNSDGALEEIYKTMTDNTKGSWTEFKDELESVGIELADDLLPVCNDFLDIAKEFVEWFGNLDEGTRKMIVQTGLLTFATGGLLKAGGSAIKTFGEYEEGISKVLKWLSKFGTTTKVASTATEGVTAAMEGTAVAGTATSLSLTSLLTVFGAVAAGVAVAGLAVYAFTSYEDMMKDSVTKSREEMTFMEKTMADLTGTTTYSKEQLEDMGVIYKEWTNNVAPETQQQLDTTGQKFRKLGEDIDSIKLDGVVDSNESNELCSRVDDLCNNIISNIQGHQTDAQKALKGLLEVDGIDQADQDILNSLSATQNQAVEEVQTGAARIKAIYQQAANEHRDLTSNEEAEVHNIKQHWQEVEIQNLGLTHDQIEANTQAWYQRCSQEDQAGLQEILKNEKSAHDQSVQQIHDKYDQAIAVLDKAIPQMTGKAKEEAEAKLAQFKEGQQKELDSENDSYAAKLAIIAEKEPEILDKINIYTGEELSRDDIKCQTRMNNLKDMYTQLNSITESGTYTMQNKVTGSWDTMTVKVDESTGKMIGVYDNYTHESGGYTEEICNDLKSQSNQANITATDVSNSFGWMANSMVNANGEIVNSDGEVVGSLSNVKREGDNVKSGIIDLNGTPIRVQCNSDGAITNMDEVINKADAIPSHKSMTISAIFEAIGSGIKSIFGFANGTSNVNEAGVYNINERGYELFDSLTSSNYLAGYSNYQQAYLNSHTRVKNHLQTTAEMKRDIDLEVNNKMSQAISTMTRGIGSELSSVISTIDTNTSGQVILRPNFYLTIGRRNYSNFISDIKTDIGNSIKRS